MKKIGMQFCPSCGQYWIPESQAEAAGSSRQECKACLVGVEYSWLGYFVLAILLFALMVTSLIETLGMIAPLALLCILGISAYKGLKQYRAITSTQDRLTK